MSAPDPERALALSYAPASSRAGLAALLDLDETLGQTLRTTREPLVGQMRLTWWHGALCGLDAGPPPAQPVLQALAQTVLPRGVTGSALARMIDGWEALLDPAPLDRERLDMFAAQRGAGLFEMAGRILGAGDPLAAMGAGWALADLVGHARAAAEMAQARTLAMEALGPALARKWSRPARPLGALALIARMDLTSTSPPGAPRRVARLAWHRLTGR